MAQRQMMRRVATTATASRPWQTFSSITPLSSPAVAAALTTTTTIPKAYSSNHNSSRHGLAFQTWLTAAAAAVIGVGGASGLGVAVQCEEKQEDPEELGPADETEDADESGDDDTNANNNNDDPYADLPDQDEPTTCTICKINRQGPCRSVWRKFEHCMKDHGGKKKKEAENADSHDEQKQPSLGEACDRYMLPWLNCVQQHRNLYTLFTNNMYQHEYVDGLEESFAVSEADTSSSSDDDPKSHFLTPHHYSVHWEPFLQHILKTDTTLEDLERDGSEARATQSINRECPTLRSKQVKAAFLDIMNSNQEPVLIESAITIPLLDPLMHKTHENNNTDDIAIDGNKQSKVVHLVEIAYVRDQYGNLLGFDEFSSRKKALMEDLMTNRNPGDKNAMASLTGMLPFHMIPRGTTMIQLFVVYKETRIPTVPTEEKTEESEQDTTTDAAEKEGVAAAEIVEPEMEMEGASRLYSTHQIPLAYVLKKHMANKTN
eukprot:scaffold13787_cov59-Attheya_sp.AAC.7